MKNRKPLAQALDLITDMVMELHFRGCNDNHPLIQRAGELIPRLKAMEKKGTEDMQSKAAPSQLHMMTAEKVAVMDFNTALLQGQISQADLTEAAFTFENEFLVLLGDDNTMPMDAYTGMDQEELVRVIQAAVENICRLRSS